MFRSVAAVTGRRACTSYNGAAASTGRRLASSASAGRTTGTEVHSGDFDVELAVFSGESEETKNVAEPKRAVDEGHEAQQKSVKSEYSDTLAHPKPQHASSSLLESTGVHNPSEPYTQQRRSAAASVALDSLSCVGFDGWPLSGEEKHSGTEGGEVEGDKDYYKHHTASPLSEIEIADMRKPITRATDGTGDSSYYSGHTDVVVWSPEQLDTAEEALLRAARVWRESAARGDPDAPQSRVLRALRGEI
ncbi:hypothetical protein SAY86_023980 [Trapa natans]|uniref:Uncharacterized protein n=1 Tax=Trapa natans TaxID=22666 RepID=A0AAN7LVT0_TRANT|nr:hypothetical protein SAY86_023980 [Trapa natans]